MKRTFRLCGFGSVGEQAPHPHAVGPLVYRECVYHPLYLFVVLHLHNPHVVNPKSSFSVCTSNSSMEQTRGTVSQLMEKKRYTAFALMAATIITQCYTACHVMLMVRNFIREAMQNNKPMGFVVDTIDRVCLACLMALIVITVLIWTCYKCFGPVTPSSDDTATEPEGNGHDD